MLVCCACIFVFQPTLPARGATSASTAGDGHTSHFNPRSPHGERRLLRWRWASAPYFNPRSPHGERHGRAEHGDDLSDFNPRSPHGERRGQNRAGVCFAQFQPTLPARGATAADDQRVAAVGISTHAPRTGSDPKGRKCKMSENLFQPTLPARGATPIHLRTRIMEIISTHAPRTGSDRH